MSKNTEISINLEEQDITNPATGQVVDKKSEYDLLLMVILHTPPNGHDSATMIKLAAIYSKVKTIHGKLRDSQKNLKISFDPDEWKTMLSQYKGCRWGLMSELLVNFLSKFEE